jgi:hypothetical protein
MSPCAPTDTRRFIRRSVSESIEIQLDRCSLSCAALCSSFPPVGFLVLVFPSSPAADCYAWQYSGWGGCSVTCGPGTQTRIHWCIDTTTGGQTVADSFCQTQLGNPLPASQNCGIQPCYAWQVNGWRDCSVTCSNGVNSRDVWCQDTTANVLASSTAFCTAPMPDTTQPCYTACTNNYLQSFTISNAVSFPFVQTQMDYSIEIPWDFTTATGTAAKEDPTATMTWQMQTVSGLIYPTTQAIQVTVRSQAGVGRVYTVNVLRRPSYNAFLDSLTASSGTWGSVHALTTTFSYTLTIPNAVTSVTFGATLADAPRASLIWSPASTVSGLTALPDTHSVTVSTRAEDGTTTRTYTIVISRLRSSIATLAAMDVTTPSTARLFPSFATPILAYKLSGRLGPGLTKVTLTFQLVDDTASVYYSLSHAGGTVGPTLVPTGGSYFGTADISIFEGAQVLTMRVVAQDGATQVVYACDFTKVSSDSKLAGMTRSIGVIDTPVVPNTQAYSLTVPFSATSITLVPTMRNAFATGVYTWQGTSSAQFSVAAPVPSLALPTVGDFSLDLRITSEDLSTFTEYAFTIHRQSNAGQLAQLSSSQADFTQSFQLGQLSYTLNLPSSATSLLLSATPTHALATLHVAIGVAGAYGPLAKSTSVAVIPSGQLNFDDTIVRVRVTAEDGTVGDVTELLVHRLSSDASLSGFVNTVEPVTITGGATDYTLHTSDRHIQCTAGAGFAVRHTQLHGRHGRA